MKLRIYSDIHLDWYAGARHQTRFIGDGKPDDFDPFWYPPELPNDKETTLILAGDLWIGTRFIEYAGFSWISKISTRFKNVLIVLGNHDYWPGSNALTIRTGGDTCNALLQDMGLDNVKVLDCDTFQEDDILIVGATLWTDMDRMNALAMYNMPKFMSYDGKIAYSTGPNGQWERFTSHKWVDVHFKHKQYIKTILEQNRDKKVVVVTHHLPTEMVIDPQYAGHASNAYYASDLSDMLLDNDNLVMWVFGHTHHHCDVMFPAWAADEGVRLYNNCVGYQSEHMEQQGLVKHEVVVI